MDQTVVDKILKAESREQRISVLKERRTELLTGIGDRTIEPTQEIMGELFDLNIILGDAPMFETGNNE